MVIDANTSSPFYSCHIEGNEQYKPDTHAHLMNLYQTLMDENIIKENESTFWEEAYGCANKYICELVVFLVTIGVLTLMKNPYRATGATVHIKYVVDGIKSRDKIYMR